MNKSNRVFVNYSRSCAALWDKTLDIRQRHPAIKTALGDKTHGE